MPITDPFLANDKYRGKLRATWIFDPADSDILVDAVPNNVPTLVTVGYGTQWETLFSVTNKSGDNASNYALTGVERVKGASVNLPEGLSVNSLNHEEFFNQYGEQIAEVLEIAESAEAVADVVNSTWITLTDSSTIDLNLNSGANRKFRVTLAGSRTLTVSNPLLGQVFTLRALQDNSGNRDLTWFAGISWEGGQAPSQPKEANKADVYVFIVTSVGDNPTFDGFVVGNSMAVPA
jgi:hypothetical protein